MPEAPAWLAPALPHLIRAVALGLPILLSAVLWRRRPPGHRQRGAIFLAAIWVGIALLGLHGAATWAGWWAYEAEGGLWFGMPVDLWLGWVLLWSVVPVLALERAPPWGLWAATLVLLAVDLLYMPLLAPVVRLGPRWWVGELVAVAVALVPALVLARWTQRDRRLYGRVGLQAMLFAALVFGAVPAAVLGARGIDGSRLVAAWDALGRPTDPVAVWALLGPAARIALGLLVLPGLLGLSAVREFAVRGGGTPFPWDPPRRLVTSGPYAWIENPMQTAGVACMLLWSVVLGSPFLALAALSATAFSAGIAALSEQQDLERRFGEAWRVYRETVRPWWPRWAGVGGRRSVLRCDEPANCSA